MAFSFRRTLSTFRTLQKLIMNSTDLPETFRPPINRNMKELDRSFFKKSVPTSAATVFDPRQTARVRNSLSRTGELMQIPGIRPIWDDETKPGAKCVALNPHVEVDQPSSWSSQLSELIDEEIVRLRPYNLELTYDIWTMQNILEAVLPEVPEDQKETPAGFAVAGHIAHVNLRNQYLPWKYLIGQVLMDKNPTIRTVINKTLDVGSESEFRTFPYEIIAGDNDLEVSQIEQGCEFRFNFAEVYWNSRLGTEHERMVARFKPGQAICDVMAGVGPFAVPAGKKRCFVRANDLNPSSVTALRRAILRNKVSDFVAASQVDGRQFIIESTQQLADNPRWVEIYPNVRFSRTASPSKLEEQALKRLKGKKVYEEPRTFDHYVMNLPGLAIEFLDAFMGLYRGRDLEFTPHTERELPLIHVYTFQAKKETEELEIKEICERISHHLGGEVKPTDKDVDISESRLVAPTKKYYRASFRLPAEVAFGKAPAWNS